MYALPAHASGKTQTCDLLLVGELKRKLNNAIHSASDPLGAVMFDVFDFARLRNNAFAEFHTK